jgi:KaiC/GvpD/RAD55 family RecA-like ATPase
VCQKTEISDEYRELLNEKKQSSSERTPRVKRKETMNEEQPVKSTKPVIDPEVAQEIKKDATTECNEFRGLSDDTTKYFLVRHKFDDDGEVNEQFYPCTQDGQLTGYKIRSVPKDFRSIGRTGADCELFGQFRFNRGGKYLLLVEGELDQLSAYQMIKEYNKSKGSDFETAVVSPTTGAQSKKQIAAQYKFFDKFDNIILGYDNDKAGKEAQEAMIKVLPKGKVKIMPMRYKDPNTYLEQGKQKEFVHDFYNAKKQVPVGVLPSDQLMDRILGQAAIAKVPFPDFMGKLNEMFIGGMPLGHIINVAADTGVGKTTLVNEMIYYWVFNSPHKIGVVSMELDAGQYGEVLLSRHLSKKLSLIPTQEEKLAYLNSDRIKVLADELMKDENGDARFYLLDNRDGTVEEIQETIEELVVACGAKVIILDPLQDILDGLSNEEQALFMKWAKGFIKSHGVTFVFINHMRKTPAGQNGADSEQNIMGSSTIIKSASANILLKRDKMAEEPIVRNTTEILVTKNRVCGLTGPAGAAYYDNETHTLHELDAWLKENTPATF